MAELPMEVPAPLRSLAIPLADLGVPEVAWTGHDALDVIESLRGTKVAILGGDVYKRERWGLVPTTDGWRSRRISIETASEYADRSRETARAYIETHDPGYMGSAIYVLLFSLQQEAA